MSELKYQIGDVLPNSSIVIRGIAPLTTGDYLYFLQVLDSNNCFVSDENELEHAIEIINDTATKYSCKIPPEGYCE
jgi:hypothetical protein